MTLISRGYCRPEKAGLTGVHMQEPPWGPHLRATWWCSTTEAGNSTSVWRCHRKERRTVLRDARGFHVSHLLFSSWVRKSSQAASLRCACSTRACTPRPSSRGPWCPPQLSSSFLLVRRRPGTSQRRLLASVGQRAGWAGPQHTATTLAAGRGRDTERQEMDARPA